MTTLSLPAPASTSIPAGWSEFKCCLCGCAILARDDTHEAPTCRQCQRAMCEKAVHEAMCVISDLRKGNAPFDVLTPQERAEQLASLIVDDDNPPPTLVRVSVKSLSDAQLIHAVGTATNLDVLIAATAELASRIEQIPAVCRWQVASPIRTDADAPDPVTRDQIESQIEVEYPDAA